MWVFTYLFTCSCHSQVNRRQVNYTIREQPPMCELYVRWTGDDHMDILSPVKLFLRGAKLPHNCAERTCPSCPLLPTNVSTCPCGATPISHLLLGGGGGGGGGGEGGGAGRERTSCLDPVPTCGNICGRVLPCSSPPGILCVRMCAS